MEKKAINLESLVKNDDKNSQESYIEFRKAHVRPWVRFWAKTIDISIFSWVLLLILTLYSSSNIFTDHNLAHHTLRSFLIIFFWFLVIEPISLSIWGTTFGRLLLNISLKDSHKRKLSFNNAFTRSLKVWCLGFCFGLPFFSLFTFYLSYRGLKNTGSTYWDKNKFVVTHGKIGIIRMLITLLLLLGPIIIGTAWQLHQHSLVSTLKITQITQSN